MGPYIILVGFIITFYVLIRRIKCGSGNKAMIYSLSVAFVLTVLLGLRHPSMGVDLGYGKSYGYLASFKQFASMSWMDIFRLDSFQNYEKGYIFFNKLVGAIWANEQFFLFCCAALCFIPLGITIGKYSRNCRTSYLIYLGLTVFSITFSALRQAIAVAITFYGFRFVREKKLKQYILTILLAWLFHNSAAVAILVYPLFWARLDRTARYVTIGTLPVFFLLRSSLWNLIVQITGRGTAASHSGSINLMLLFCAIYVYLVFFSPEKSSFDGLINLHYITCCILIFSEVSMIAQRVGYFFMIYLILLLPELLQEIKIRKGSREYWIHLMAVVGGFLMFGVYNLMNTEWAGAYPYYFFWKLAGL